MTARAARGAPIEIVSPDRARYLEPGLSDAARLASYCAVDGYAGSYLLGGVHAAGSDRGRCRGARGLCVHGAEPGEGENRLLTQRRPPAGAPPRLVRGCLGPAACCGRSTDLRLTSSAGSTRSPLTERMPPLFRLVVGAATGLLTLKQAANGTVLIGGGWQGRGDPETGPREILPANLIGNLRLAGSCGPGAAAGPRGARLAGAGRAARRMACRWPARAWPGGTGLSCWPACAAASP